MVHLVDALITAQAKGGDGAHITIDPPVVILDNSIIDGRSITGRVPVDIVSRAYLKSPDSQILSDAVTVPVEVDIAGSLARLASAFVAFVAPDAKL